MKKLEQSWSEDLPKISNAFNIIITLSLAIWISSYQVNYPYRPAIESILEDNKDNQKERNITAIQKQILIIANPARDTIWE